MQKGKLTLLNIKIIKSFHELHYFFLTMENRAFFFMYIPIYIYIYEQKEIHKQE